MLPTRLLRGNHWHGQHRGPLGVVVDRIKRRGPGSVLVVDCKFVVPDQPAWEAARCNGEPDAVPLQEHIPYRIDWNRKLINPLGDNRRGIFERLAAAGAKNVLPQNLRESVGMNVDESDYKIRVIAV